MPVCSYENNSLEKSVKKKRKKNNVLKITCENWKKLRKKKKAKKPKQKMKKRSWSRMDAERKIDIDR